MPRRPQRMLLLDLALAACLVSIEIVVVILWLLCFLLAVNHVLEPWTNAGLLLYGPGLVVLAAMVGVPGAAWAHRLSEELALPWSRRARAVARTGSMALALGGGVALVAWMVAIV